MTDCEHMAFEAAADLQKLVLPDISFVLSATQDKVSIMEA